MATDSVEILRQRLPYRDCAGIALFNRDGRVFVGKRRLKDDAEQSALHGAPWQMPQGGIDKGEAPLDTARRELYEETGVTSVELLAEAPDWVQYDLPDDLLGKAFKGRYRGQRQRWFAFLFTGEESEIDVLEPGGGRFHPEFDDWRWAGLAETPDLIVDFKRDAYRQIAAAFAGIPEKLRRG